MSDANQSKTLSEEIRLILQSRFREVADDAIGKSDPKEAAEIWEKLSFELSKASAHLHAYEIESRRRFMLNWQDHEWSKTPAPVGLFEQPKSP